MDELQALTSCSELTAEHAIAAAASAADLRRLFMHCARIAKPEEGCPKVLMVLARVSEAEWLDGELTVEITGDDNATTLAIFADHGFGIRERVISNVTFPVPFEEFERALMIAPALIQPMRAKEQDGKLLLGRSVRESDRGPVAGAIAIGEKSLHENERKTAPPQKNLDELEEVIESDPPPRPTPDKSGVHTHPTVRRMVAIRPEALRSGGKNDD